MMTAGVEVTLELALAEIVGTREVIGIAVVEILGEMAFSGAETR